MEEVYIEDKTFNKVDFSQKPLAKGEYEQCSFIDCDFSNADFTERIFIDCTFSNCKLDMVILAHAALRGVKFKDSKMLGWHFQNLNQFGLAVQFDNCILNHSSFFKTKLKKTTFKNCSLHEVDFSDCDLSGAVFDNCDLANATFDNTIIEKASFITSFNYSIHPESNKIKKAKFSQSGIAGLLNRYDIVIEP